MTGVFPHDGNSHASQLCSAFSMTYPFGLGAAFMIISSGSIS